MKLEFSDIFLKNTQNPTNGSRAVPCGGTDGQTDVRDEVNSRFSQFCERI